jgi:hypothetical protein
MQCRLVLLSVESSLESSFLVPLVPLFTGVSAAAPDTPLWPKQAGALRPENKTALSRCARPLRPIFLIPPMFLITETVP